MIFNRNMASCVRYTTIFLAIAFLIPLSAYAWMGSYMRYSGDDYCYGMILTQFGFWKAQVHSYLEVALYHGNRYSLTLLSGISQYLIPNSVLPGLTILIWFAGLFSFFAILRKQYLEFRGWEIPLSLALIFFTLLQAPDLYQILYWRSGMLPYLAPLVVDSFLVAVILRGMSRERVNIGLLLLAFLLAFLAGGFSETAAALQMTVLSISLFLWIFRAWKSGNRLQSSWILLIAWAGASLAIFILIISPVSRERLALLPDRPNLFEFVKLTILNTYIFVSISVRRYLLPVTLSFLLPLSVSWYVYGEQFKLNSAFIHRWLFQFIMMAICAVLTLLACFAPTAYLQVDYPEARVLITARWVTVLFLFSSGWLTGQLLSVLTNRLKTVNHIVRDAAVIGILILAGLFAIVRVNDILAEHAKFQKWAALWDQRDAGIWEAKRIGHMNIDVMQLDHIIPNVGDLSPDSGFWYNGCAAGYYGVGSISANQPGWDD